MSCSGLRLLAIALAALPPVLPQTPSSPEFVVPAFTDLTIKTQHVLAAASSTRDQAIRVGGLSTELLYLKGPRERRESAYERSGQMRLRSATILQCAERRLVNLNLEAKLYTVFVLGDSSQRFKRRRALPEGQGADVTTTFDAVDTGERRRVGHYVARRVRTTTTVDPSSGANTPASTRETDGWYIDLPGLDCSNLASNAYFAAYLAAGEVVNPGGLPDHHHYVTKGVASRGYTIEETTRFTQAGLTTVDKVQLIELSERRVDPSLFEIPRDYRPALPLVNGGYDITKPDTVANRVQDYLNEATRLARAIFAWAR